MRPGRACLILGEEGVADTGQEHEGDQHRNYGFVRHDDEERGVEGVRVRR